MKTPSQKSVWDKIAPEWYEFKTKPAEHTLEFLKDKTGNVLDLGSGAGRHLIKIKKGKMYLADFSKKMIEFAKKRAEEKKIPAEFFVADLTKLPFENNFFDSAICIALLHCVEGESTRKKVIEELFRVLKHKGKALISVWNTNHPAFKRFKNKKEILLAWTTGKNKENRNLRYYYFYNEDEFLEDLKKTGFKILDLRDSKENTGYIVSVEKPQ